MDLMAEWSWFLKLNCSPDSIVVKGVLRFVTLFSVAPHLVLWEILVTQGYEGIQAISNCCQDGILDG